MTKFAKISLVAAVAVAGLTTANAQPLEQAIKNVDVSGMMRYRLDTNENINNAAIPAPGTDVKNSQTNNYRLDVVAKSKVNDAVTANVTFGIGTTNDDGKGVNTYDDGGDEAANVLVRDANFAVALPFATVITGKQSIPGPFVDNTVDDVARGTGAVALVPVGGLTLAAGYFNNNNLASPANVYDAYELAVIGSLAGINADIWYLNVDRANKKAYSVHANTSLAGVMLDGRYTNTDNGQAGDNATLAKLIASTKVAGIDVAAGYITTGKNNSAGNLSLDGDADAQVDARVWQARMANLNDAKGALISLGTQVVDNVNAKVTYINVNAAAGLDASELLFDASYKMSNNFVVSGKYSTYEVNSVDNVATRIEVKYTF